MTAYTVLGEFDWGGDLLVEIVGADWSEERIELEAAVLGPNGWCSTLEAKSADEALQMAGRTTCDETQLDTAVKLFDVRSGRQLVYEGRTLAEQEEEQSVAEFAYEAITVDEKFPTFRVWQRAGWGLDFLGVIRNTKNSLAKKRFPDSPLLWTATLAIEADPATWDKKATCSTRTREEGALWLLGCRDAITNPKADAARAMLGEDRRRSAADNVCPVCGGKVSSEFVDGSTTKCESCEAELYRTEADRTPFHKPLWKPVGE